MNISEREIERYMNLIHKKSLQLARWRCHLQFNRRCLSLDFIPPSLRIKDPVRNPFSEKVIHNTHRQLLRSRFRGCMSNIRFISKSLKGLLTLTAQCVAPQILTSLIVRITDEIRTQNSLLNKKHDKKFYFWSKKYGFPYQATAEDHRRVLNLSSTELSEAEISLLSKGLNYRNEAKPDVPRIISGVEASIKDLSHQAKNDIRSRISSVLMNPTTQNPQARMERTIMKRLKDRSDIIICNSDKGSQTVVMDISTYRSKMMDVLTDESTFIPIDEDAKLRTYQDFRKALLEQKRLSQINSEEFKLFTSRLTTDAYIYGLPKIHKPNVPLRPIVACHRSPSAPLARYLSNFSPRY
ncbi:hypothetical protein LAZ67_20000747 [Cordylochernes scorpioides]|uniref:Uncharacterized protein n=1 Tax=Cordylochernes scorpioides TaxID=51811 RepID=A0ABY6LJD8_9ARAC|nr:hypothetical protein LAZ67_20000747 [Cordylochernes scorpioides]